MENMEYNDLPLKSIGAQSNGLLDLRSSNKQGTWLEDASPNRIVSNTICCQRGSDFMKREFHAFSWGFDGNFQKVQQQLQIEYNEAFSDPVAIADLNVYPLKYAPKAIQEAIRERGELFWSCRKKRYVCLRNAETPSKREQSDERFMIDIRTYKSMHPGSDIAKSAFEDGLGPSAMAADHSPPGDFIFLLPAVIFGFNMQDKKWLTIDVGRIMSISWNKNAFETLVLDGDTKELITALVTNQIAAEQGTDLMSGKGNGLIVLLHGAPRTGKTLTAESVAEIAEKPFYRVTCGDIPTNPNEVEKHLDTVLYLGKVWGCVVLLDEADVFLEQRTLQDLQRNALVSVFLRVLEYYEGILVLTSNRVGTFDEAFKSRIQLSLRYENLTEDQRLQIWSNFLRRLETFQLDTASKSVDVDVAEVRAHLKELASTLMNGRQIRNAVTTARQLALFNKRPMGFRDLQQVINVAGKFDKYLLEVHENLSEDAIARDDGRR